MEVNCAQVLHAAGVEAPRALVLVYTARARLVAAVRELQEAYPEVPIYARALDARHAAELKAAGATDVVAANTEAGSALGSSLLRSFGAKQNSLQVLTGALRKQARPPTPTANGLPCMQWTCSRFSCVATDVALCSTATVRQLGCESPQP